LLPSTSHSVPLGWSISASLPQVRTTPLHPPHEFASPYLTNPRSHPRHTSQTTTPDSLCTFANRFRVLQHRDFFVLVENASLDFPRTQLRFSHRLALHVAFDCLHFCFSSSHFTLSQISSVQIVREDLRRRVMPGGEGRCG
jgi:hypothetical protein